MSSYNFNMIKTDVYNKTKVSVMQVNNLKPDKNINIKEMANLYKTIQYKLHKDGKKGKIMIQGLSPTGWTHLKGYDQLIEDYEGEFEQYYSNRIFDETKFHEFAQIQFYIATSTTVGDKVVETPRKPKKKKVIKKMFIN